jgi:hypothetical protein
VANASRDDAVPVMSEFIAMTIGEKFGTHQGDQGKEGFNEWWAEQKMRQKINGQIVLDETKLREIAHDAFVAGAWDTQE